MRLKPGAKSERNCCRVFESVKLWEVLHAHIDLEPDCDLAEFSRSLGFGEPSKRAIIGGATWESGPNQEILLENAIELALDRAFLTLFDRGALKRSCSSSMKRIYQFGRSAIWTASPLVWKPRHRKHQLLRLHRLHLLQIRLMFASKISMSWAALHFRKNRFEQSKQSRPLRNCNKRREDLMSRRSRIRKRERQKRRHGQKQKLALQLPSVKKSFDLRVDTRTGTSQPTSSPRKSSLNPSNLEFFSDPGIAERRGSLGPSPCPNNELRSALSLHDD